MTPHLEQSPFSRLTQYTVRFAPYGLVLLACLVRLQSLAFQSLWRDEVDAVRFALAPLPDVIKTFTQPGFNGPLYFLMLRGWIGLAGQSEFALRLPSLFFGVISIALIYVVGTRLFSRPIGLVAALLLAFSGYHVWYSQEAKMYTLITLLALAAIYCLRRALSEGRVYFWIGLVVCTSLAMYAHILAALLIPTELLLCIAWWPKPEEARQRVTPALIAFALLIVPYLPLAAWQLPLVFKPGATGYPSYTLDQMLAVLNSAYTRGILNSLDNTWSGLIAWLAAALAILGWLTRLLKRQHFVLGLTLLIWLFVPLLSIWFVSLNRPLFTDRYLIWSLPAYYLSVALGIEAIGAAAKTHSIVLHARRFIAALALLVLIGSSLLSLNTQATTPYKSDFRSAAAVITQAKQATDVLLFQIPYIQTTFDYYYKQPYTGLAGPYTNYPGNNGGYQDTEAAIFTQLDLAFEGKKGVWLIASEVAMWDQRNLLQRWLDAHGTRTAQHTFAQVTVTRYALK